MARYRIVLEFEGPKAPSAAAARYLPGTLPVRYYAQLVRHLLELDPDALGHSLTRADVAKAFPDSRLVAANLAEPES